MSETAVITGIGLVTPLGNSVEQTCRALLAGEFIRDHARAGSPEEMIRGTGFQPVFDNVDQKVESTPGRKVTTRAESPCHVPTAFRLNLIALTAAREAIAQARWDDQTLQDPATALVVGTSKGPIASWMSSEHGNAASIIGNDLCFGLAELTSALASQLNFGGGARTTLSAACASGLHALIHAVMQIRSGVAKRALVIAAEASVHPLFIGSFKRLGVLPREGVGCRPFDQGRDGFLISEAAAAVCVEAMSENHPHRRGGIAIDRFALAGDATHLTGGDPDGKTLRYILRQVIDARPVDLIHAHATGTPLNDPIELAAIEASVAESQEIPPSIYSHKGAMGHSLGASGLVSVVLNCMSHRQSVIPPNVRTQVPIGPNISATAVRRQVRRSVALAAGFGGAMAAVSLSSNPD
jgi:3-oxoacyl-[acyl-carrier-protein] synthase II